MKDPLIPTRLTPPGGWLHDERALLVLLTSSQFRERSHFVVNSLTSCHIRRWRRTVAGIEEVFHATSKADGRPGRNADSGGGYSGEPPF